jgi:alpha-tubulin suppressor-like RCC1 family protein
MMRAPSPQQLCAALLLLLTACADPENTEAPILIIPDDDPIDMPSGVDMPADLDADPCAQVSCGEGGRCVVMNAAPSCECDEGLIADGLRCVPAPRPPSLDNLPATENGVVNQPDSFQLMASDPDDDPLTFSVNSGDCPFVISADSTGKLGWTCPSTSGRCDATVRVSDSTGLTDMDTLRIQCRNDLPAFSSTPPTAATEGQELRYAIACADPNGSRVTLSVAPDDTCGGVIQNNTYVLTPAETKGGANCLLRILCSDGEAAEAQSSMIAVAETNQAPKLAGLPGQVNTPWQRAGSFDVGISDADLPAQALTVSLVSDTCSFPLTLSALGLLSFTCGPPDESCAATIRVSDGQENTEGVLDITCENHAPSVTGVAITPPPQPGDPLTCAYTFNDPDGDADNSSVEWLVAGVVISTGTTFSNYLPGDSIVCRVAPNDTLLDGPTISSPAFIAPDQLALAAGRDHTCAIRNGALLCWGRNDAGQLGDGTGASRQIPTQVAGMLTDVSAVSAGNAHTCAIQDDALYCWGYNLYGQVGDGSGANRSTPTPVAGMASDVTAIVAGGDHACALQGGALKCWGRSSFGQIGDGSLTNRMTPVLVTSMTTGVSAISAGLAHTCAVHQGALKCWGYNISGQLGDGTSMARATPTQVTGLTINVSATSAGSEHTCAVHSGALKCWGRNDYGQLGDNTLTNRTAPIAVAGMATNVTAVSAGGEHTCAIQSGALKCWGQNDYGQLGDRSITDRAAPLTAAGMASGVSAVSSGSNHTCAIQDGAIKCWGYNINYQLGTPNAPSFLLPVPVYGITSPALVTAGADYTCVLQNGGVKCLGYNNYGQLGDGSKIERASPSQVTGLTANVSAISAGSTHACAVHNGGLKCWGRNNYGQLGNGSTTDSDVPVNVVGMASNVFSVSVGTDYTCATQGGALKCWGLNNGGQLGDGTITNRSVPTQVMGMTSAVLTVAAGDFHTCAIQNDALKCWGYNDLGQIGHGGFPGARTTPVQVSGLTTDIAAVAAGNKHTCAIKLNTLSCWGSNSHSQLSYPLIETDPRTIPLP